MTTVMSQHSDRAAKRQRFTQLNPQYPTAWWAIGFSHEVTGAMAAPNTVLERDIVLWRDSTGALHCQSAYCPHLGAHLGFGGEVVEDTLRCPFHGFRFAADGLLVHRPQEKSTVAGRCGLSSYRVEERYGIIFMWNGDEEPDYALPDVAGEILAEPGCEGRELVYSHHAYHMPYPAKWFVENAVDNSHFVELHQFGDEINVEIVDEAPWKLHVRYRMKNPPPFLSRSRIFDQIKRGEFANFFTFPGIVEFATYLGVQVISSRSESDGDGSKASRVRSLLEAGRVVVCFTPTTAHAHVLRFALVAPKVKIPVLNRLVHGLAGEFAARRHWGGIVQDAAIMMHRDEPERPAYSRADRNMLTVRRNWDNRIADRTLWAGDNIHSNGLRAGIQWPDAPPASERPAGADGL